MEGGRAKEGESKGGREVERGKMEGVRKGGRWGNSVVNRLAGKRLEGSFLLLKSPSSR